MPPRCTDCGRTEGLTLFGSGLALCAGCLGPDRFVSIDKYVAALSGRGADVTAAEGAADVESPPAVNSEVAYDHACSGKWCERTGGDVYPGTHSITCSAPMCAECRSQGAECLLCAGEDVLRAMRDAADKYVELIERAGTRRAAYNLEGDLAAICRMISVQARTAVKRVPK